jgi:hypothetical protein
MHPIGELIDPEAVELAERATRFLKQHRWCVGITEGYLAWSVSPIVGVFLFRLAPIRPEIDSELWVIVGDLPPAYIVCDAAESWQQALDAYGVEMMRWVDAVRADQPLNDVIPVDVPPTLKYADMLESRIKLLWERFVDMPSGTYPTDV